uniref:Putative conserved secreted protein n=1 Tax=Panstrongylus lignarius TaxID=156445 RepID=A0A224XLF2_9HEMI
MKLTIFWVIYSLIGYCICRPIEDKLMTLLKGMSDEQLTRLEEKLAYLLRQDEQMQGDMPLAANESDTNRSTKERDKKQRLDVIKQNVLLFANRDPNSTNNGTISPHTSDEMQKKIQELLPDWKTSSSPTTKIQGFYPSCELPRNTDEEAWQRSQAMNLYFDLPFAPNTKGGPIIQIHSATLKLFKLSQGNTTIQITEDCSHQSDCEMENGRKQYIHYPANGGTLLDKQIRVSVYWYTRSLKKHRIKKKLLDSQMMPEYGEAWTEFNVKSAINAWRESGRNFGLTVEVEDEDRIILNALKYFEQMNCSVDANVLNNPLLDRTRLFPIVDLATIEFQESDTVYQSVKYPLRENSHRVRHHHVNQHQRSAGQNTEEPPANDSIERIRWEDASSKK